MSKDKKIEVTGDHNYTAGGDINFTISSSTPYYVFDPQTMADIINALYEEISPTSALSDDFKTIDLSQKNRLNGIEPVFFDSVIRNYYPYFNAFDAFFKAPRNRAITEKYYCIQCEIQGRIVSDVRGGKKLQDILPSLFDYAKIKHQELFRANGYLLNLLAYYMYTRCDIGIKE